MSDPKKKWLRPPTAKLWQPAKTARRPVAKSDAIERQYHLASWFRFRESFLSCNPVCQALDLNGEQCHSAATICHHLVSPYVDASKFFDWQYVVGVCDRHHPYGPGEPLDACNRYAETKGLYGATCDPNVVIARLKGN
jgi:hypothetical protein